MSAGAIFTSGWITRCISSYHPINLKLYIVQTILIYAAPPIYAATEYNILGRLMHYLPMHAPLNPNRVLYFFTYLGAIVLALNGSGAGRLAAAGITPSLLKSGASLLFGAAVLQIMVECLFISMVARVHYRASRSHTLTPNVRNICILLYGSSTLILIRFIFRAIEGYDISSIYSNPGKPCEGVCKALITQEWVIYAFDGAPMVFYTWWLNVMNPGRFLPSDRNRYLDFNKEERIGPGWIDKRSKLKTFIDPFDVEGLVKGQSNYEMFWLPPHNWSLPSDGNFTKGTATNIRKGRG